MSKIELHLKALENLRTLEAEKRVGLQRELTAAGERLLSSPTPQALAEAARREADLDANTSTLRRLDSLIERAAVAHLAEKFAVEVAELARIVSEVRVEAAELLGDRVRCEAKAEAALAKHRARVADAEDRFFGLPQVLQGTVAEPVHATVWFGTERAIDAAARITRHRETWGVWPLEMQPAETLAGKVAKLAGRAGGDA